MTELPTVDWPTLLRRAPHFSAALVDALCDAGPDGFAPHVQAVYYFDLFDAQVSNGGVDQYFDNVVARLPDAARVPAVIAANPVYAPALALVEDAHAIWTAVAPADPASDDDDDYQQQLEPHAQRLEDIAQRFYAIHHGIRQRLEADIVADPHRYFDIEAIPTLRGAGVEHVVLGEGTAHLRFADGFPVGPNTFECAGGGCDVVWFSPDRTLLQAETAGYSDQRDRQWIHYPSQASGSWTSGMDFMGEARSVRNDRLALGLGHHGLHETFRADGHRESASLHWHGEELCSEHFYDDGTTHLRIGPQGSARHWARYWPNGALNTESIEERDGRSRYLRCLAPDGEDLAPRGTGRLVEMLSVDDEMRQWREGELVEGFLTGMVRRLASLPDGSQVRETERTLYKNGRPH